MPVVMPLDSDVFLIFPMSDLPELEIVLPIAETAPEVESMISSMISVIGGMIGGSSGGEE